nr:MAG TPA: Putative transferase, nesg, ydcK, Structural Genomics.38A [Caudoviricetes sp.]
MSCKYDIIDEGGRKRVRALRHFTVQGRDVCPMELGGYVYDANTLSQEGNCWIFSGSLEYPGVRVLDESIVDMGNNLPKVIARPKATIISGNSRIMGAISFETQTFSALQTPAMFEQGVYNAVVGSVPIKIIGSTRVCTPAPIFAGTAGTVAITSADYKARLISLNEYGIVTSATAWTVGGPAVTLTSTAPYILVDLRKVDETAITPADVTAAGITITQAGEATVRIFNSSIVPVYNGSVTLAASILRYKVTDTKGKPYQVNIQNSYLRIECSFDKANLVRANADFTKVNYNLVLTPNVTHYISGTFRNTNMNTPASVNVVGYAKSLFDVSDCPNFEFSTATFLGIADMIASGKTFYFKQCNMPAGSAIIYYDPLVTVWDNIDFTKAMADLGRRIGTDTYAVSSNVQGMYRLRSVSDKAWGAMFQSFSSISRATISTLSDTYNTVIYKDCVIKGILTILGRNVFGGTLGGASKITNTAETAMVIDGSFRIEGNAQVTDTSLKGNGYIGGNAEIKNGSVEGYIYMDGNAKYIPAVAVNPHKIAHLIMRDNAQVLKQRDAAGIIANMELYDNAVLDAIIANAGLLIMRGNSLVRRSDTGFAFTNYGNSEMKDNAKIDGLVNLTVRGGVTLIGGFALTSGNQIVYGKRTISDVSQIAVVDLPQTKTTW